MTCCLEFAWTTRHARSIDRDGNPFNPSVTIAYDLAQPADVVLQVFDVRGRLVRELAAGSHSAGRYVVQWSGEDRHGARVASGVYFARFEAGEREFVERLVMVK